MEAKEQTAEDLEREQVEISSLIEEAALREDGCCRAFPLGYEA